MNWGNISAQKLERERSKSCAVSISLQSKTSGVTLESAGLENIPEVPGNRAEVGQNYDGREKVSATLSLLKSSGAIFRPRSSKVSVQKILLSILLQTKDVGGQFRVPGTGKYPPSSGKFNRS